MRMQNPVLVVAAIVSICSGLAAQMPNLLYLPFNEGSGATTADLAVPGQGGPAPGLTDPLAWDSGSPWAGNACWSPQPGTPSHVMTPFTYSNPGSFTLEFAVFPTPPATPLSPMTIIDAQTGSKFELAYNFGTKTTVNTFGFSFDAPIPSNEWTFVSIVYVAPAFAYLIFLDGELVDGIVTANAGLISGNPWWIGFSRSRGQSTWNGKIDEIRLWDHARTECQVRAGAKGEITSFDLAVGNTSSPPRELASPGYYSSAEPITAELCNIGTTPIPAGTVFTVDLEVDGTLLVSDVVGLPSALLPGSGLSHTFSMTADLSAHGPHHVRITSHLPGDTGPANDAHTFEFRGGGPGLVDALPWSENFDTTSQVAPSPLPAGWSNVPNEPVATGTADWIFRYKPISANATSPPADHTGLKPGFGGGLWAAVLQSAGGLRADLRTPCIEIPTTVTAPTLVFYVHDDAPTGYLPATFGLQVTDMVTGSSVWGIPPAPAIGTSPGWRQIRHDLSPWIGSAIALDFSVVSAANTMFSLDDVSVFDAVNPATGQAPRPGIATLDVSGAVNPNEFLVTSGLPGPYRRGVRFNGNLDFLVTGAPLQPVAFLGGVLNPLPASFPGAGQLDIGSGLGAGGVPLGISIHATGFAPVTPSDFLSFTDATGELRFSRPMDFPFQTLQVLVGRPGGGIAISNAVTIE